MQRNKVWAALMASMLLAACGHHVDLPDPRAKFPVVSEEFTAPVEQIGTIVPSP